MGKYATFWPRWWAGFVDGLVLLPFTLADNYLSLPERGAVVLVIWTIISCCAYPVYSVTMHSRSGQTVGKRSAKIRVLNVGENRIPSLRQAILRDIGTIVSSGLLAVYTIYLILTHNYSIETRATSLFLTILGYANLGWFLIEITTMFMNEKRRAFHDLIAGTVVVHTSYESATTGLGLSESGQS